MEGPSTTTPIEGSEEAWSTIATEGGGILAEYVEEGLLQVHRAGAHDDAAYLCTLCSIWNNGHEQAILHLFCKEHARNSARSARRAGQGS